jgi:hypothetical protein
MVSSAWKLGLSSGLCYREAAMTLLHLLSASRHSGGRLIMTHIEISEQDAALLLEMLSAKLTELRREESHTDSPRFRKTLYDLDGMLQRVMAQLPQSAQS